MKDRNPKRRRRGEETVHCGGGGGGGEAVVVGKIEMRGGEGARMKKTSGMGKVKEKAWATEKRAVTD